MTIAPRFAFGLERFLGEILQTEIESCDHGVSRHRRSHDFLRRFSAVLVEGNSVFSMLPRQHLVEGLLETFPALRFRPKHFVIVDDAIGVPPGLSAVTNDLPRDPSVRIGAHIIRTHGNPRREAFLNVVVFLGGEILRDLERQNPAIPVMTLDQLVRDLHRPAEQPFGRPNFFVSEGKQLRIGKIKRSRKTDHEIVAQPVLGERRPMAVGDLSAGRGDVEDIGSRELLRLKCGHNRLFGRCCFRRGRGALRLGFSLRQGQPTRCEQAKEPEQRRPTQIHKGNCGGPRVIDKRKCKANERLWNRPSSINAAPENGERLRLI